MSVVGAEIEWHLTPRGWVKGSEQKYFSAAPKTVVPPPEDRVETWLIQYSENEQYGTPEGAGGDVVWFDSNVSEEDRAALRKKLEPTPWSGHHL